VLRNARQLTSVTKQAMPVFRARPSMRERAFFALEAYEYKKAIAARVEAIPLAPGWKESEMSRRSKNPCSHGPRNPVTMEKPTKPDSFAIFDLLLAL